jgi:hypothetical protein
MCRSQSLANTVFERFNSRVTNFMTPCPRLRILRGMFGTVPGCQTSHQSFLIVKAAGLPRARCVGWSVQHEDLTFGIELRLFCAVRPKIRDQNSDDFIGAFGSSLKSERVFAIANLAQIRRNIANISPILALRISNTKSVASRCDDGTSNPNVTQDQCKKNGGPTDSKSGGGNTMWVQVPPSVL